MHTLAERLQPLADALAVSFAQGATSAACAATLGRLLPGLQYASLAIANPAPGEVPFAGPALVAAANLAAQGPCTLHLLDAHSSAAGLALQQGKALKARLSGGAGAGAGALARLADVQLLLAAAPAAQLVLCIPFGCGSDSAAPAGEQNGCPTCSGSGATTASGALLLGLDGPDVDTRRLALVVHLAQCLPRPLARLSADTLALVKFACGSNGDMGPAACCCCPEQGWEEEVQEQGQGGSCSGGKRGGDGGGSGSGPTPLLRLRLPAAGAEEEAAGGAASQDSPRSPTGPSMWRAMHPSTDTMSRASSGGTCSDAGSSGGSSISSASGPLGVSKALAAAAAAAGGDALLQQSRLTLRFASELAEREYGLWMAPHYVTADQMTSLIMITALALLLAQQPLAASPCVLCLCAGMAVHVALNLAGRLMSGRCYIVWRERLLVCLRLTAISFACLAAIPAYQAKLPAEMRGHIVSFWRLTGAEVLALSAITFTLPQRLHIPLQAAALGVVVHTMPRTCGKVYPAFLLPSCLLHSISMALALGCLLPTAVLRQAEKRSRTAFARMLRAPAAQAAN